MPIYLNTYTTDYTEIQLYSNSETIGQNLGFTDAQNPEILVCVFHAKTFSHHEPFAGFPLTVLIKYIRPPSPFKEKCTKTSILQFNFLLLMLCAGSGIC